MISTISEDLLPAFTESATAHQIWCKTSRLFAAASDVKVTRIKHDLHSVTKGDRSVEEFLAQVKRLCDLLATSGHELTEREKIQVVLPIEFDSVITMATFSLVRLNMELVIEALLECESRQRRFVSDSPLMVTMVRRLFGVPLSKEQRVPYHSGRRFADRGHGWSSRGRMQCQICNRVGHTA